MGVHDAIREAESLLPGVPVADGQDPRWQAIIAIGDHIESEPEAVWKFIVTFGGHEQEDVRDAIACCLLEHLLEHHFDAYFPRVQRLAIEQPLFGDMFLRCWKFGQSKEAA